MADLKWDKAFAFEQSGEDDELLKELLDLLISSSADDLAKVRSGLEAGDGQVVADASHSIKGAAASLGVEGLREVAHMCELKGRDGEISELDVKMLEEMVNRLPELNA